MVNVGKGCWGSTFNHPARITCVMSCVPSRLTHTGDNSPVESASFTTLSSISQSIQYNRGRLHQVKLPALHNIGRTPIAWLITSRSLTSIEATDSMRVKTGHQAKCLFRSSRTRGTYEKRHDLASFSAPCLSKLSPLTPWHGGPAPSKTKVHWENRALH